MAFTIHHDPTNDLIILRTSGHLTPEDAVDVLEELARGNLRVHGRDGLIDATELKSTSMTFDWVRRLSDRVSAAEDLFRGTRWAVVAPGDVIFGIARMYESLRSGGSFEVRAFRSLGDAESWLRPGGPPL